MKAHISLRLTMIICVVASVKASNVNITTYTFGPFDASSYTSFEVVEPATISNDALQITPDTANDNFSLMNRSGRILYKTPFKIWNDQKVISFNTSFLINIYRKESVFLPGEGLAFIIAPNLLLPANSYGGFLGLTNASTDGQASNQLVAVELDTFQQDFDINDNHIGIDVNSVKSVTSASLTDLNIELSPVKEQNYIVWVDYNGDSNLLEAYIAKDQSPKPPLPTVNATVNLKSTLSQLSYFGFAASTGNNIQLNCVLRWNLTIEILDPIKTAPLDTACIVGLVVGILVIVIIGLGFGTWWRKGGGREDTKIRGTLKSLPGTPREFEYKELRKATNRFDESRKLGAGGFGVVYRGLVEKEGLEIAVKKFLRDDVKGKDEFLQELMIINRLRHKHLVKLLGWCHRNEMLLLVYEYMPNGSLDHHLYGGPEKPTLPWSLRYNIISGVASALHYLHREYDQKVVHRDLKASNIMLTSNFDARLGDFGLARALDNEKTSYKELEGFPGTMGYIAPECFHTAKATVESDVYAFGAVVLEVVCGQRPWTKSDGCRLLVDQVWKLHQDDRILEVVDKRLGNGYVVDEANRLLLLALACSNPIAASRPNTKEIVQILSGLVPVPYVPPFKPAFIWCSSSQTDSADSIPITSSAYASRWWLSPQNSFDKSIKTHGDSSAV